MKYELHARLYEFDTGRVDVSTFLVSRNLTEIAAFMAQLRHLCAAGHCGADMWLVPA
jgi:hypothetical protein